MEYYNNSSYQSIGATGASGVAGASGASGTIGASGATEATEATGNTAAQASQRSQQAQQAQQAQQPQQPQQPQQSQRPQQPQQSQQAQPPQPPQWPQQPQQPQQAQQAQWPQQPQQAQQPRQPLTPQPFLPKKGNYQDLVVYQKALIIYDLTYYFANRYFIARKDRTVDQLVQAARSGKQNIVEGCAAATTSSETELKLLGVARASMKEVQADYEDYLRTRGLELWPADDPRAQQTRTFCRTHTSAADYTQDLDRRSPEALCNIALTLLHQYDRLMEKLLDRLQKDFVAQGGVRERMFAARLGYRNEQKACIVELETENAGLKDHIAGLEARIAGLEALIAQKGGGL